MARVFHADLWGEREGKDGQGGKYGWLFEHDVQDTPWQEVQPQSPAYLFVPQDKDLRTEYEKGWPLPEIMDRNGAPAPGIVTTQDEFAISFTREEAIQKVESLLATRDEVEARRLFRLCSQSQWNYDRAKFALQSGEWKNKVVPILYRPFDSRWTVYDPNVAVHLRKRASRHLLGLNNMALCTIRSQDIPSSFSHVFITNSLIQHHTVSLKEVNFFFPLFLFPDQEEGAHLPDGAPHQANFAPAAMQDLSRRTGLAVLPDPLGDLKATFGPENYLQYLYAIFHCPSYRSRYAEFLKSDFPRVPLTSDRDLFRALCEKGGELVALHLLESPLLNTVITRFPIPGEHRVEKGYPKFVAPDRVHINADQYFEGVPEEVWSFHIGGYQVAHKWLKDRQGRQLSYDDLTHYQKTITALHHTLRIMRDIDALIPKWPLE